MFILQRLISKASRSLGVMLGNLRRGAGHAQGGREGDCHLDTRQFAPSLSPFPFLLALLQFPAIAASQGRRLISLV
jgi:hypothetical protein